MTQLVVEKQRTTYRCCLLLWLVPWLALLVRYLRHCLEIHSSFLMSASEPGVAQTKPVKVKPFNFESSISGTIDRRKVICPDQTKI